MLGPSHTSSLSLSLLEQCHGFRRALGASFIQGMEWGNLEIRGALNQITVQRKKREAKTQRVTASLREARNHSAAVAGETMPSYPSRVAVSPTK